MTIPIFKNQQYYIKTSCYKGLKELKELGGGGGGSGAGRGVGVGGAGRGVGVDRRSTKRRESMRVSLN